LGKREITPYFSFEGDVGDLWGRKDPREFPQTGEGKKKRGKFPLIVEKGGKKGGTC